MVNQQQNRATAANQTRPLPEPQSRPRPLQHARCGTGRTVYRATGARRWSDEPRQHQVAAVYAVVL